MTVKEVLSGRVSPELKARIEKEAARREISPSEFVSQLLEDRLPKRERDIERKLDEILRLLKD